MNNTFKSIKEQRAFYISEEICKNLNEMVNHFVVLVEDLKRNKGSHATQVRKVYERYAPVMDALNRRLAKLYSLLTNESIVYYYFAETPVDLISYKYEEMAKKFNEAARYMLLQEMPLDIDDIC